MVDYRDKRPGLKKKERALPHERNIKRIIDRHLCKDC